MSDLEHRAPAGKFIVGELFYAEDEWNQVGEPYGTLDEARAVATHLKGVNRPKNPELDYYVYDDQGHVPKPAAAH